MSIIPPEVAAKAKLWLLVIPVLLTHLAVVWLGIVDRLVFAPQAASGHPLLDQVADSHIWIWLNGVAFLAVGISTLWRHRLAVIWSLSFSFAILVGWGLLAGVWGLLAPIDVSLLGPVLALVVGFGARLLAFGVAEDAIRPGPGTGEWR